MFKRVLLISTSIVALGVAMPSVAHASWINDFFNEDVAKVRAMQSGGDDFQSRLASEYRTLALFEADEMYDFPSSDYFAKKALAVSRGEDEIPAVPQVWDVDEKYMNELVAGRDQLTSAFKVDAKVIAPSEAAVAQAKYDCWVEQVSEGYSDPWQPAHIADCKADFFAAMDRLNASIAAAQPKPAPEAPKVAATPPTPSYVPLNEKATIYFAFDRSDISADAQNRIDRLVERIKGGENIVVTVEAHTDKAGAADYNKSLSERRATAIKNELIRQGVIVDELDKFEIVAEGESKPAVNTADGIQHPLNRRAEIVAYRLELDRPSAGKVSKNSR